MKTFKDLVFEEHIHHTMFMKRAVISFDNGYGVSVVTGNFTYTDEKHPYELAVLKDGSLCYDTKVTNDVCGYLTAHEVTEKMFEVQRLVKDDSDE